MAANDKYAEKARDAGAKVRQIIDGATGEVTDVAEVVESKINEKPVQATLIALAAGFVLGLLLRRR